MDDRLLAIEVHEVTRAFTLRARLEDFDPEVVPGSGDSWQIRVGSSNNRAGVHEVQEALSRVREWLIEEGLSAAIVHIGGAREVITPDP
jgi:hypothetical protein